jgi:hypothetical protein
MSSPSMKIVVFIDGYGWNGNVPAHQDSHGPLYIDQTHQDSGIQVVAAVEP